MTKKELIDKLQSLTVSDDTVVQCIDVDFEDLFGVLWIDTTVSDDDDPKDIVWLNLQSGHSLLGRSRSMDE